MTSRKAKYRSGLLVVRRINWASEHQATANSIGPPALLLSRHEILTRYRGFDGEPWPALPKPAPFKLQDGLAMLDRYADVRDYYLRISQETPPRDLLYLDFSEATKNDSQLPSEFVFCGYDYGFYQSEWSCFSSLYHEVLFGNHEEMRAFAKFLNDVLLFPSIEIMASLASTRERLLQIGADLEDSDPCGLIRIYAVPRIASL